MTVRLAVLVLVAALAATLWATAPRPPRAPAPIGAPDPREPAAKALLFGGRLDLATATTADLEALPGIGPARARAIVAARARGGGRMRLDDLLAIDGIGPAVVAELRPYVTAAD